MGEALRSASSPDGRWHASVDADGRLFLRGGAADRRLPGVRCGTHTVDALDGSPARERRRVDPDDLCFSPDGRHLVALSRYTFDCEYYYGGGYTELRARVWLVTLDDSQPPRCIHGVSGSIEHYSRQELPPAVVRVSFPEDGGIGLHLSSGEMIHWAPE